MWSNIDLVVSRIGRIHVEDKKALIRSIAQEIADYLTSISTVDMKRGKQWAGINVDEFEEIGLPKDIADRIVQNNLSLVPCVSMNYYGYISGLYYVPEAIVFAIAPVPDPLRFEVFDEEEFKKMEWGDDLYNYAPDEPTTPD